MMARQSADPSGDVLRNEVSTPKGPDEYKKDTIFRAKWDSLQEKLRCCGWGNLGYRDYKLMGFSKDHDASCLPNSCLIDKDDDDQKRNARQLVCTHKATESEHDVCGEVWMQGCISILKRKFSNELDKGKYTYY